MGVLKYVNIYITRVKTKTDLIKMMPKVFITELPRAGFLPLSMRDLFRFEISGKRTKLEICF